VADGAFVKGDGFGFHAHGAPAARRPVPRTTARYRPRAPVNSRRATEPVVIGVLAAFERCASCFRSVNGCCGPEVVRSNGLARRRGLRGAAAAARALSRLGGLQTLPVPNTHRDRSIDPAN
jgi:hypothetical protein